MFTGDCRERCAERNKFRAPVRAAAAAERGIHSASRDNHDRRRRSGGLKSALQSARGLGGARNLFRSGAGRTEVRAPSTGGVAALTQVLARSAPRLFLSSLRPSGL